MAVYKQGKKEKKTRKFHISKKAVGITFIVISCLAFFFLFTNLLPFMRKFIFGTFGYFSYVLFVYTFMLGVALVNNKKYTMSKKYTAFLYLSIIFLLCIIQMIMIGDKGNLSFGQYLAKNYTHHCIGGVMIGLLTTSILYLTGIAWTYVIFCVCFIISVALFINLVVYMHRQKRADAPVWQDLPALRWGRGSDPAGRAVPRRSKARRSFLPPEQSVKSATRGRRCPPTAWRRRTFLQRSGAAPAAGPLPEPENTAVPGRSGQWYRPATPAAAAPVPKPAADGSSNARRPSPG